MGGKLTTAVRSLDDAIMDLLGVAHLIRVVRTDKSFVANETLATAWSEVRTTPFRPPWHYWRQAVLWVSRTLLIQGHAESFVLVMPPSVVFRASCRTPRYPTPSHLSSSSSSSRRRCGHCCVSTCLGYPHPPHPIASSCGSAWRSLHLVVPVSQQTYRRAASDLSDWVERTQRLLTKGRRLTQSLSTVRRLTCLVALGPTPTAGLLRPLSVSDPIGVRVTPPPRPTPLPEAVSSTRNEAPVEEPEPQPPIVLRLLPDGTPSLPPLRSKPSCLAFRLIHGPSRSSQCATLHLPALGLNRDLAASLKVRGQDHTVEDQQACPI